MEERGAAGRSADPRRCLRRRVWGPAWKPPAPPGPGLEDPGLEGGLQGGRSWWVGDARPETPPVHAPGTGRSPGLSRSRQALARGLRLLLRLAPTAPHCSRCSSCSPRPLEVVCLLFGPKIPGPEHTKCPAGLCPHSPERDQTQPDPSCEAAQRKSPRREQPSAVRGTKAPRERHPRVSDLRENPAVSGNMRGKALAGELRPGRAGSRPALSRRGWRCRRRPRAPGGRLSGMRTRPPGGRERPRRGGALRGQRCWAAVNFRANRRTWGAEPFQGDGARTR